MTPPNHRLTLSRPSGTLVIRMDTQSTRGTVVLTTHMVLSGSAMEQEPPPLHSTLTGITPLRGILFMVLTKQSGWWRELDDSSTQWGNFVPPLTQRLT
jgi:hypothetical protein